jgi:hypothetical protein
MRSASRQWLVLFAVALGAGGAPLALPACGARTGLPVPSTVVKPCVIASTAPGTVHACEAGTTSISGTVYDPAAKNPLYDVVVYVPSSTPQPIAPGASCNSCDDLYTGNPIATALTDADGNFTLSGVPDGTNIPLVLQIGKWRRQLTLANVVACQDNPQPDKSLTLPRSHADGDIPSIAVSTGGADTLECIFVRLGLDPAEYGGGPDGAGRIHIFQGTARPPGMGGTVGPVGPGGPGGPGVPLHAPPNTSPPGPSSSAALWDSDADIFPYDMVFLSCEGAPTANMNQQVLFDYAAAGGRVYATHFHYAWFDSGPFGNANLASWVPGSNAMGNIGATIVTTLPGGQPFPQGAALAAWLNTTGALVDGELPIVAARHNADVGPSNTPSQAWILADQNADPPGATQYFTFNTPLGAAPASQCGQVVFTDIHVGAASNDMPSLPVPEECANIDLSPQETALEFVLYNLASCVTPPGQAPAPPPACVPMK